MVPALAEACAARTGCPVSVLDVFRFPTVRLLAALLRDGAADSVPADGIIVPAAEGAARRDGRARLARGRAVREMT